MADKFLKLTAGIPTMTTASASSGVKNYILNGDGEIDTTGWAAYADAGSRPVDGTGGSPTVTITRSTSSPLRGVGSLLLTKDAANRQGQGVSYAFTIDAADKAKVINISMDWAISSGTYSGGTSSTDSDVIVYIYDVTNSVLIEPAPIKLDGGVSGTNYRYVGSFQAASNSVSYRLILHVATTSASAYVMQFDNVIVGPSVVTTGGYIGDWQSYTPTFTGFGTPTGISFWWRKVGDSAEIRGKCTPSTHTATEARITLPLSLTSDTTKIPSIQACGHWWDGNPLVADGAVLIESGVGYVTFGSGSGGNGAFTKLNGSGINNSTGDFGFYAVVPIQGFGTSQVLSSDTDTRIVSAIVTGTPANVTSGNPIIWPTVTKDSHGAYNATTGRYTAYFSGWYQINVFATCSTASNCVLFPYIDAVQSGPAIAGLPTALAQAGGATQVYVNAGQIIDVRPNQSLTSFVNATANGMSITRVSGPSQIAATDTIVASVGGTPANMTGGNPIIFPTVVRDTHGAYNATTGEFTVPISGTYQVDFGAAAASGTNTVFYLYVNGSRENNGLIGACNGTTIRSSGSKTIYATVGQKLTIVSDQSLTTFIANTNGASFKRIGN